MSAPVWHELNDQRDCDQRRGGPHPQLSTDTTHCTPLTCRLAVIQKQMPCRAGLDSVSSQEQQHRCFSEGCADWLRRRLSRTRADTSDFRQVHGGDRYGSSVRRCKFLLRMNAFAKRSRTSCSRREITRNPKSPQRRTQLSGTPPVLSRHRRLRLRPRSEPMWRASDGASVNHSRGDF